jgi:hypothetical protein
MKFILTDNVAHIPIYRMQEAHFVAELQGAKWLIPGMQIWKVVKNKLTGELGWMSWAEVKQEIS